VNRANSGHATLRWTALLQAFGLLAGWVPAMLLASAPQLAWAQSNGRPTITIAPIVNVEASGQTQLVIAVGPPEAVPPRSFIRLRGLPPMAALSEAYAIAPGAWAVALNALPNLMIMVPVGFSGRSEFLITLVGRDGSVLAEAKSELAVVPRQAETPARASVPAPAASMLRAGPPIEASPSAAESREPAPSAPTGQIMSAADQQRAQRAMKKADEELEAGNVSAARLLYEFAADAGLAQGAMALAATFDADELAKLGVRGVAPDPKEARRWYERARQLGAADAAQRITRLGAQ
jgi:hypothetical protein